MKEKTLEYAGFWVRFGATCIDTFLFLLISAPLLRWAYSGFSFSSGVPFFSVWNILLNWIFPLAATVAFWVYRSATPGKMALKLQVLDAKTGEPLSVPRSVLRYFAYYISAFPLCLGFIWVAFNSKKQGWHDLIARTVVVRPADRGVEAVQFHEVTEKTPEEKVNAQ
ncbi:RDD family protein [Vibrio aerogenes CECT 7868]|uniref:RDD family protein n=1 Tax=Vibrio aerogenes CECT 7868 TaxID=1216006 RepID=A0A1M5ZWC4_9VIBR|nr:RDD family protein [Vibrio aerogenes]SHI28587.1 RDD family protein [Vibrio aerogenes CECT 7868]